VRSRHGDPRFESRTESFRSVRHEGRVTRGRVARPSCRAIPSSGPPSPGGSSFQRIAGDMRGCQLPAASSRASARCSFFALAPGTGTLDPRPPTTQLEGGPRDRVVLTRRSRPSRSIPDAALRAWRAAVPDRLYEREAGASSNPTTTSRSMGSADVSGSRPSQASLPGRQR